MVHQKYHSLKAYVIYMATQYQTLAQKNVHKPSRNGTRFMALELGHGHPAQNGLTQVLNLLNYPTIQYYPCEIHPVMGIIEILWMDGIMHQLMTKIPL